MVKSHGDFVTIIDLPEGEHHFKFFVDGQWKHDPHHKIVDNDMGSKNNVISVKNSDFEVFQALAMDSETGTHTQPGEWGQVSSLLIYCCGFGTKLVHSQLPYYLLPHYQYNILFRRYPRRNPGKNLMGLPSYRLTSSKWFWTRTYRLRASQHCFPNRTMWCSTICTHFQSKMASWCLALPTVIEGSTSPLCCTSPYKIGKVVHPFWVGNQSAQEMSCLP